MVATAYLRCVWLLLLKNGFSELYCLKNKHCSIRQELYRFVCSLNTSPILRIELTFKCECADTRIILYCLHVHLLRWQLNHLLFTIALQHSDISGHVKRWKKFLVQIIELNKYVPCKRMLKHFWTPDVPIMYDSYQFITDLRSSRL